MRDGEQHLRLRWCQSRHDRLRRLRFPSHVSPRPPRPIVSRCGSRADQGSGSFMIFRHTPCWPRLSGCRFLALGVEGWLGGPQRRQRLQGLRRFGGGSCLSADCAALACVMLLRPGPAGTGKYVDGKIKADPSVHSMPLATIGVFLLFLGWFGFKRWFGGFSRPLPDRSAWFLLRRPLWPLVPVRSPRSAVVLDFS